MDLQGQAPQLCQRALRNWPPAGASGRKVRRWDLPHRHLPEEVHREAVAGLATSPAESGGGRRRSTRRVFEFGFDLSGRHHDQGDVPSCPLPLGLREQTDTLPLPVKSPPQCLPSSGLDSESPPSSSWSAAFPAPARAPRPCVPAPRSAPTSASWPPFHCWLSASPPASRLNACAGGSHVA